MATDLKQVSKKAREYEKEVFHKFGFNKDYWYVHVLPAVWRKYNDQCGECGGTKNLDVHHKSYSESITINDLELLCRKCHSSTHKENK